MRKWLDASSENLIDQNDTWGTLDVLANPGNGGLFSQASGWSRFGHSWLKLTSADGKEKTFGTFKKGVVQDGRNAGKTFQINYEKDKLYEAYEFLSTSTPITKNSIF